MKRIPRDPLRIDVFGLFAAHAQEQKVAIHTPGAAEGFLQRMRTSMEALLDNAAFVYGQRTQALFEALVVDLGEIRFLKQEDAGDVYSTDDLEIPDFRLILADGTPLLVEVKNYYYQADPTDALVVTEEYLAGLRRYAALMGCQLKVAVFWTRWNMWTLVAPKVFTPSGTKYTLAFGDAMTRNEMALLGDKLIGTAFPLRMRFVTNPATDRTVKPDGSATFTLSDIKLFCRDTEITDPVEKNIAWYLMMYGRWESPEPPEAIIVDGQLEAIEERFMPVEDHGQGFEMIGYLSGIYSACFRQATVTDGRIGQVRFEPVPGQLGRLIPTGYKGSALPVWVFILSPAKQT